MPSDRDRSVRTASRPSQLKITDLRVAPLGGRLAGAGIIRIDTNQGICGYGEVQAASSNTYALMLKSRIVGENPCDIDRIFRSIKQFGHHGRQGAGVSAIEMALVDLAGRAYDVPAYQLVGGKFRDRILCYADTPREPEAAAMVERLQQRLRAGFQYLKMDVGIDLVRDVPDALIAPGDALRLSNVMHPFGGIQITEKGIDVLCAYVAAVRSGVGYQIPLAADHFGRIGLESCIRLGKALDQFCLAWYEDMIPWQFADQWQRLSEAVDTPLCTGEDIDLTEGVLDLFSRRAIAVAHHDLALAGGVLVTRKIGDLARDHGISMALHMGISPVGAMAAVHCAAATENFLALEIHSADELVKWSRLVEGLPVPLVQDGYIQVPETAGLGFTALNEDAMRQYTDSDSEFFVPTTEWDRERSHDRLWS